MLLTAPGTDPKTAWNDPNGGTAGVGGAKATD